MPTIPKAGLLRSEENSEVLSNSRTYLPSPSDRSDNETKDDKTRRKLRKAQGEPNKIVRRPTTSGGPPSSNNLPDSNAPVRRKLSVRTQKPLIGARPLTRSPSKIAAPDASAKPRSTPFTSNLIPSTRHAASGTALGSQLGTSQSGMSLTKEDGNAAPFLPEVNFDDLHSSITADLNLYDLAAADDSSDKPEQTKNHPPTSNGIKAFYGGGGIERKDGETRISRTNSLQKRQLDFGPRSTQPIIRNPALVAASTSAARARRQSHFPSSTTTNSLPRIPRKSIGPGVLPQSSSDYNFLRRGSATFTNTTHANSGMASNISAVPGSFLISQSPTSGSDETGSTSVRANRAKHSQISKKNGMDLLSPSYDTADHSFGSSKSPLRHSTVGTPNSNISSKRLSIMPGHATGLGARTVSPTDAHRMRRRSMMPNAPPVPQTPPIATPEISPADLKAAFDAVSQVPRKSETPSSNRTTPDPNRKSITSIMSAASITSLSSARGPNTGAGRNNSGGSVSRLPTLKGRSEATPVETGEYVPPVPAIPKAYESPKYEHDISFQYPPRKPSLQFDASRSASVSTADFTSAASTYSSDKETPRAAKEERKHMKMSVFPSIDSSERASGAQDGRRTLQPIKLPPLNPFSLRTPTNEQIASLATESSADGTPPSTPPAKKSGAKIPSTPMTASRTNFFSRRIAKEESNTLPPHLRSSSSYYQLRSDGNYGESNLSSQHMEPIDFQPPRKTVSPFTSASLPKDQNEFETMQAKRTERDIMGSATEPRPNKLTGPRAQTSRPIRSEALDTSGAFTDTEKNSFGNALRRKLSITRRRSNSKIEGERPPQPPDHEMMPPPKLPTSTTWNNINQKAASPTMKSSYLQSRRKSVHVDALAKDRKPGDGRGIESSRDSIGFSISGAYALNPSIRAVSSSIPAAPKMYNVSHHQPARLPSSGLVMDGDDLEAEEEMKKLASKRKKAELEARELDELRKRAVPREGVTATQALRAARLNLFERGEIVDFKSIHFCGTQSAQKLEGNAEAVSTNFGYDDERGDYNIVLGDHLAYRYEVVDVLGKGSFGQVVRCVDHKTGGLVAIKIIRNKKRFHQQALVEVDILQKLRNWDPDNKFSMVNFTAHFYFRGHLCISTELLGINLYEFIKLHDFKGFSLKLIRRFTKQIVNSLLLLQSHRIIHCDLKPENILLAHPAQSEIKVIDFGSSCHENERVYTYIQSRFYRSPEVILGMTYGMPIDMWSVGCILAELLTGYPIFPGENEQEQLACIMEIFGPPDKSLIEKATRKKLFFDSLGKPRLTVSSKGKRRRPSSRTLQQALKCDDEAFLDFLIKCFRWDPERRLKPDEAMVHEFITGVKVPASRSTKGMQQSGMSSSPMKRFNSVHTSSTTRPLPDPPNLNLKNSITTGRIREPAASPTKPFTRRYSTAINVANGVISTRKGSGMTTGGALAKTNSSTGRPDLASAAAAVATTRTR